MPFKFEKLEVWQLAMEYLDLTYELAHKLPEDEKYNIKSQMIRAATSIVLNISEGLTGQSNNEQARFLGYAIRSLMETVACQHILKRRGIPHDSDTIDKAYNHAEILAAKLHTMRKAIAPQQSWLREGPVRYGLSFE